MQPDEEAFVRRFVVRDRRDRWLALLAQPKSRAKITERLYHHTDSEFDARYVRKLGHTDALGLIAQLRSLGAGDHCSIISNDEDDGSRSPLHEAIERHYGCDTGAVLICVPDRLAYVEAEDDRFLLSAL